MKKILLLLTLTTFVMSCRTYTIYDRKVLGVVDEVYTIFHQPYKYKVYVTTYEDGRRHFVFKTNIRYEIGNTIEVPIIK